MSTFKRLPNKEKEEVIKRAKVGANDGSDASTGLTEFGWIVDGLLFAQMHYDEEQHGEMVKQIFQEIIDLIDVYTLDDYFIDRFEAIQKKHTEVNK